METPETGGLEPITMEEMMQGVDLEEDDDELGGHNTGRAQSQSREGEREEGPQRGS